MKIAIDVSQIIYGTGVSTYTRNLVKSLISIDVNNEYILFGGSLRRLSDIQSFYNTLGKGNYKGITFPIPPTFANIIWNRLHKFPIETIVGKVDIFHSSDWTQPPTSAFKVSTIHDIVPFKFPDLVPKNLMGVHKSRFALVKKEVDRVIVPSNQTAKDVAELGIEKRKIRVIPEAPDPSFKPKSKSKIGKIKNKYDIKGHYLLAIGVNKRKNTKRIIRAYEKLRESGNRGLSNLKLVIIGHPYIKIRSGNGIKLLGHVPYDEMPVFYSGAEAMVYPSLYEGFGLPILEAYACKTPVITSNLGSMRELAENAAVLIDPKNIDSIIEGIMTAIKDRKKLVVNGKKVLKKYSWEKTAKVTLKVYKELN